MKDISSIQQLVDEMVRGAGCEGFGYMI
jgi:hypothetical protein